MCGPQSSSESVAAPWVCSSGTECAREVKCPTTEAGDGGRCAWDPSSAQSIMCATSSTDTTSATTTPPRRNRPREFTMSDYSNLPLRGIPIRRAETGRHNDNRGATAVPADGTLITRCTAEHTRDTTVAGDDLTRLHR